MEFGAFSLLLQEKLQEWRTENNNNILCIRNDIRAILSEIRDEIKIIKDENVILKTNLSAVTLEISDLKQSLDIFQSGHEELKKRVDELSHRSVDTSPAVLNLQNKLNSLEQQNRQFNIEMCNVPERRHENLQLLVDSLSDLLKIQIPRHNVLSIHRVPHAQQQTAKPKNIIIKFTTRILRDNVLTAFRKIKNLNSGQLGFTGTPQKIYMNEHLTLNNKQLFRKTREVAKLHNYKYVWVKNAKIFVREKDGSSAFIIHSQMDLDKIKLLKPC